MRLFQIGDGQVQVTLRGRQRTAALELSALAEALKREGFAVKTPAKRSPVTTDLPCMIHAFRTLRPLRRLRYGRQLVRTLHTHLALIVARFTEHLSRARRQATSQRTDTPQQRQGISV